MNLLNFMDFPISTKYNDSNIERTLWLLTNHRTVYETVYEN